MYALLLDKRTALRNLALKNFPVLSRIATVDMSDFGDVGRQRDADGTEGRADIACDGCAHGDAAGCPSR